MPTDPDTLLHDLYVAVDAWVAAVYADRAEAVCIDLQSGGKVTLPMPRVLHQRPVPPQSPRSAPR